VIEVSVSHGEAAVLYQNPSANTLVAGATISIELTAADSDGNVFAIDVDWSGSAPTDFTDEEEVGKYSWHGTTMGNYSLEYSYADLSGTWDVSVTPSILETLEMTISPSTDVLQQETITIDVRAFDAFGNEIDVPVEATVYHGGDLHVTTKVSNSQWQIYMLDEGQSKITVVADEKYDEEYVQVSQTMMGFFEAGGTLYYIGAGLLALIVLGVIATLVVLLRRAGADDEDDDDFYDEYDDYEEIGDGEYDEPESISDDYVEQGDTGESESGGTDANISVDEDGTEWWEDEEGVWWYRSVDMDDWEIWED